MRLVLQIIGGIWVLSMLFAVSSCFYIGHVISDASQKPGWHMPGRVPVVETTSPSDRDRIEASYYHPSPVPTATYVPGRPMLDPTPQSDRRGY